MAKEGDLKKTELKVSVHCCDGCKKKVRKALRSMEGVFKTEIDPLEPKVTILGNLDPQTLIKKLLKAGKQAEIWSNENQTVIRQENKETKSLPVKSEKENSTSGREQTKPLETRVTSTGKLTESAANKEGGGNKVSKTGTHCITNTSSNPGVGKIENAIAHQSEANCMIHPSIVHDTTKVRTETETQYYYMVEPCPVILPYYAIYPYKAPPLAPTYTCSQEIYNYAGITCQPPVQAPTTPVGDYFSDENTVGCQVM